MCLRWGVLATAMLLSVAGCGQTGPVADVAETVDASGVVTYKGAPLEGYTVTFMPQQGIRAATGMSDASGRFVLGTNDAADGAEPGQHKVAVVWTGNATDDGLGDVIDDPRKLPKPPVQLPKKYSNPETSGIVLTVPEEGTADLKVELL